MDNVDKAVGVDDTKGTNDECPQKKDKSYRPDCLMFGLGLVFIAALIGAMFGLGIWRQWDANSGYYHNSSLTSSKRFLPEPTKNDPYPQYRGRNIPGAAGLWYYWKNKPDEATLYSRLFAWLGYSLHQISIWVLLYLAQVNKIETNRPKTGILLNKYNWISFGLNIFFHLLHLLNTHTTYDALAPDTVIVSSQCSVIMLLIVILVLEYNERGMFFGWPVSKYHKGTISRKMTLNLKPVYLVRKYHGYAFSWAAIYTFWYHPMESTYGHALGFFHTWAIMLQGSLMYTDVHLNRWWRLLLESWVLIHGSLVAVQTSEPGNLATALWPMFFFGFLMVFCLSQIYLLPFWTKIPNWVRAFPPIVWLLITVGAYSSIPDAEGRNWVRLQEVIRIPAIYYLAFVLTWAFMYLCMYIDRKIYGPKSNEPSPVRRVGYLVSSLLIFVGFVALSVALEMVYMPGGMFVLMIVLVVLFSLGCGLVFVLMSHTLPKYKVHSNQLKHGETSQEAPNLPHKEGIDNPAVVATTEDEKTAM